MLEFGPGTEKDLREWTYAHNSGIVLVKAGPRQFRIHRATCHADQVGADVPEPRCHIGVVGMVSSSSRPQKSRRQRWHSSMAVAPGIYIRSRPRPQEVSSRTPGRTSPVGIRCCSVGHCTDRGVDWRRSPGRRHRARLLGDLGHSAIAEQADVDASNGRRADDALQTTWFLA